MAVDAHASPITSEVARSRAPGMVSDRIFRIVALLGGLLVLAVLALIAYSTTQKAWPWFKAEGVDAVFSDNWAPSKGHFGALGLMYGTLLVAAIALVMAVPVSVEVFVPLIVGVRSAISITTARLMWLYPPLVIVPNCSTTPQRTTTIGFCFRRSASKATGTELARASKSQENPAWCNTTM